MSDREDINGDGIKDVWIDTNGDGVPDAIDFDANGFADGTLLDLNSDGIPDAISLFGVANTYFLPITTTLATSVSQRAPETTSLDPSPSIASSQSVISTPTSSPSSPSLSSSATTPTDNVDSSSTSRISTSATSVSTLPPSQSGVPKSSTSGGSSTPVAAIVGGVIGGLLVIVLILGLIWLIIRERRKRAALAKMNGQVGGIQVSYGGIENAAKE
ncbi:hypothetical protein H072_11095 [Dactylellina haptotyla CBS 200.50]|uniref:Mid2 domain-containing protein n=1 Tax=Dactylellina haptotyla (strain CBS 200.50) TaxID=1284197 RepID=S8BJR9_DACHA|nr:hypothetical protein H072_11095 [Dactylellina haptotyla CBS 200.50]